jgi:hypothetical protein
MGRMVTPKPMSITGTITGRVIHILMIGEDQPMEAHQHTKIGVRGVQ